MILITGHRGFIGSRLKKEIDALGIDIRDGLDILTCDLPEATTIYHLASQTSVKASWSDPLHDMENLRMTVRLVKEYPNSRIIFAGSAAAEDPQSPYGFSKWASAEYLKRFHKDYVICVFPNVYGEGSHSVVEEFKNKEEVIIYGDGLQTRDYVHVDDIVQGLIKAKEWPKGEYHLGSGIATTVLGLAEGKSVRFQEPRKEARNSILLNTTPNWAPKINIMEYLHG